MIHRLNGSHKITVCDNDGVDHELDPGRDYDDSDPTDAKLLREFPGFFRTPNVEAATAAPGEKRTTRR